MDNPFSGLKTKNEKGEKAIFPMSVKTEVSLGSQLYTVPNRVGSKNVFESRA